MGELTEGVNWLAVGVGTVLSFLLGWAWYSPLLFVKKWIEGINVKPNPNAKMPAAAMVHATHCNFSSGLAGWHRCRP